MGTFVISLIVAIIGGILPGIKNKFGSYNVWSALVNLIVIGLFISSLGPLTFSSLWIMVLVIAVINMLIGMLKEDEYNMKFTYGTFYTICLFFISALLFFSNLEIIIKI